MVLRKIKEVTTSLLTVVVIVKKKIASHSNPKYIPISNFLQSCTGLLHKILNFLSKKYYSDLPLAVYDLRCSACTYDFAYFLYEAECHFRNKGHEKFHVIIVPETIGTGTCKESTGYNKGIASCSEEQLVSRILLFLSSILHVSFSSWKQTSGYDKIITSEHERQRTFNIVLPIASLYGSCASVNLIDDARMITYTCRSHSQVYPENYDGVFLRGMSYNKVFDYERKQCQFSGLKALALDLDKVKSWLTSHSVNQQFVTFTIRHYDFQPERNSNIPVYLEFASYLSNMGIGAVFIPDTEDLSYIDQISDYPVFFAGAFNLYQRQAIYELALTNIFNSNGCSALCALNISCSYIMSGIVNRYWTAEDHESRGLKYGSQPFCDNRGVWVWESETLASLQESLNLLLEKNPNWLINLTENQCLNSLN